MDQIDLSLDILMKETFAMTEMLRLDHDGENREPSELESLPPFTESAYEDNFLDSDLVFSEEISIENELPPLNCYPNTPGVIYKIDRSGSTFCVRGFSTSSIQESMIDLGKESSDLRSLLKILPADSIDSSVIFFQTSSFELALSIKEQILNRRFPLIEDSVCNISDPGFSWWMNIEDESDGSEKFQIFFRSHGVFRTEKYIQLGPIGDGAVAALKLNQARSLFSCSFPISEFSCDDKCFTVATTKPDHLSFISFLKIFLTGENNTDIENFPDNPMGRSLYYYFHELAIVRKFWIEVKTKLG
jgi:hypothetical protein